MTWAAIRRAEPEAFRACEDVTTAGKKKAASVARAAFVGDSVSSVQTMRTSPPGRTVMRPPPRRGSGNVRRVVHDALAHVTALGLKLHDDLARAAGGVVEVDAATMVLVVTVLLVELLEGIAACREANTASEYSAVHSV